MAKELGYLPAFILHTRAFKENQLLMEVLVAGEGRISIVGYKGSKKNTAKTALLQPFRALVIQIKKSVGLRTLKSVDENQQLSKQLSQLKGKALFCGFYLNELICRLCSADAEYDQLYALYVYAVRNLADISNLLNRPESGIDDKQAGLYLEWVLRQFEYKLLQLLGYGISFETELSSQADIIPNEYYQLHIDQGFTIAKATQDAILGRDIIAVSELLERNLAEHHFVPLDTEAWLQQKSDLKIAKAILRVCLHRHLGDKPLKSRELFRK